MEMPRKISASPQSAYYNAFWATRIEVSLDGEPQKHAVTADIDEGWVDVQYTDASGAPMPDGHGEAKVIRLYGRVEFNEARGV